MVNRLTGALCLAVCALAGCGGSKSPPDSGGASTKGVAESAESKRVRAVVQESITTTDPKACTRLFTLAFIEQRSGERGAAAVKQCRDDADEPGATSLSIDRVAVSGPNASADIRPRGGGLPFKNATIGLHKTDGRWQVSRLKSGTLDRGAFARTLRHDLTKPPDAVPAAVADCAVHELDSKGDAEIARAYLKPQPLVFVVPVAVCAIRRPLERQHIPAAIADCIVAGFRRELTTGALGRKLAADPAALSVLQSGAAERLGQRIARACAARAGSTSS